MDIENRVALSLGNVFWADDALATFWALIRTIWGCRHRICMVSYLIAAIVCRSLYDVVEIPPGFVIFVL